MRVLLVDDNPDDRALLIRQLKLEYPRVSTLEAIDSTSFEQGLSNDPGVVVTDYQLKWTDGLTVLKTVKRERPDTPVIMFTGTGNEEIAVEAMHAGLDDYLIKTPQHYARIRMSVRQALERATQRRLIQEHQDHLQALLAASPDAVLTFFDDFRLQLANPVATRVFGLPVSGTSGSPAVKIDALLPELPALLADWGVTTIKAELVGRTVSGTKIPLEAAVSRTILRGRDYYICTLRDIALRKHWEAELIEARQRAEAAVRAKTTFLANMSHELRTPLNAIIGFSETITGQYFGPVGNARYHDYVTQIQNSGHHLLSLINDILDLSRIEIGQLQVSPVEIDLRETVDRAAAIVASECEKAGLICRIVSTESPVMARADETRTHQILLNLLSNAVKFSSAGGSITVTLAESDDRFALLTVEDTGIGMAAADVPRAFEPFQQLDNMVRKRHDGVGLGLSIVKRLVEAQSGRIDIVSIPNQGTRVTVRLPKP